MPTNEQDLIMQPGHDIRVERYSMSVAYRLTLGEPQQFDASQWTMTAFKPQFISTNALAPGFVILESVVADAVELLWDETFYDASNKPLVYPDAWDFRPGMPPKDLNNQTEEEISDFHDSLERGTIRAPNVRVCDHGISMFGRYTGLVPPNLGRKKGDAYTFIVSLRGPADFGIVP
jgi:hypothetical protein